MSATRALVDPRSGRFGAAITSAVLALALVLGPSNPVSWLLLLWQLVAFGLGALAGVRAQPYGWLFRKLLRPRLGAPVELEDPAPPRFAQAVGLVFVLVATIGLISGVGPLFFVAAGLALAAALLNAAFGLCLGCEIYLLVRRVIPGRGALGT